MSKYINYLSICRNIPAVYFPVYIQMLSSKIIRYIIITIPEISIKFKIMNYTGTRTFGNDCVIQPVVPMKLLEGFIIVIFLTNSTVFLFSISWLIHFIAQTFSIRKSLLSIGRNVRDTEVYRKRYNIKTHMWKNLMIICILFVEAFHLIIKGIGFGLFFIFEKLPQSLNHTIITHNFLNNYSFVRAFRFLQVSLVRIGLTNGLVLLLLMLFSILMVYLSKAYREHRNFYILKNYLVFGLVQFFIVLLLESIIQSSLAGSFLVFLFLIVNLLLLARSRSILIRTLKLWWTEGGYYEDRYTYNNRRKYVVRFRKWSLALLMSLMLYALSIALDNTGNWLILGLPNPWFLSHYYNIETPVPNACTLRVTLDLTSVLFILSNIGTLQFDLFLIFSNIIYYLTTRCYYTTRHRDQELREKVGTMISKAYKKRLL